MKNSNKLSLISEKNNSISPKNSHNNTNFAQVSYSSLDSKRKTNKNEFDFHNSKNTQIENDIDTLTNNNKTDILEHKPTCNKNVTSSLNKNHIQNQVAQTSQTETFQNKTLTRTTYNSSQEEKQYSTQHNTKNKEDKFGQFNEPEDENYHSDTSTSSSPTKKNNLLFKENGTKTTFQLSPKIKSIRRNKPCGYRRCL